VLAVAACLVVAAAAAQRGGRLVELRRTPYADTAPGDREAHLDYLSSRAAFSQGYSDTANQQRARADAERAVARDPGYAPAWSLLSQVYAVQYRSASDPDVATIEAAERAAARALALDPQLPDGHLAKASVLFSRRDHEGTRRALGAGRPALEGTASYWHLLALLEQREGNWRASEAAFSRAFNLDGPGTAEWLAVHFLHLRRYREARRVVAVALASSRTAAVVPDSWARFSERGDIADARPGLEVALRSRTPPDARVLGLLAQLEWFDGKPEQALALIDTMDESGAWLAPNFRYPSSIAAGDVLDALGRRSEARARYGEALATLEHQRLTAPDNPKLSAALGMTYAGLGRAREAVSHLERAVALRPRREDAAEGPLYLYLLARVHARLGRFDDAFAVLDTMFDGPGFYSEAWIQRDPTFAALRAEAAYAAHLERWSSRKGELLLTAHQTPD